jgi:hypothetical protein
MSNLDLLTELSRKLAALLKEPQPGLLTWRTALYAVIGQIAEFK